MSGAKLAECVRAIESTFGGFLSQISEINRLKTKTASSFIVVCTSNLDIEFQNTKYISLFIKKPITRIELIKAVKQFYQE